MLCPKPRSLGIDLRASNLEQQALALALMGCVTLDKSTPFTESPLCLEPEDCTEVFSPALSARLHLCPSCSVAGQSRHIPNVDSGLGTGQAPLGMASGWPQDWNLALLCVSILGALDLCQTLYSSEAGGRVPAWACVCPCAHAVTSH